MHEKKVRFINGEATIPYKIDCVELVHGVPLDIKDAKFRHVTASSPMDSYRKFGGQPLIIETPIGRFIKGVEFGEVVDEQGNRRPKTKEEAFHGIEIPVRFGDGSYLTIEAYRAMINRRFPNDPPRIFVEQVLPVLVEKYLTQQKNNYPGKLVLRSRAVTEEEAPDITELITLTPEIIYPSSQRRTK